MSRVIDYYEPDCNDIDITKERPKENALFMCVKIAYWEAIEKNLNLHDVNIPIVYRPILLAGITEGAVLSHGIGNGSGYSRWLDTD